jgi:hypothetical protein
VRKDDVAVVQFDGKCRAWEHLFDTAEHLEWGFFAIFRGSCF